MNSAHTKYGFVLVILFLLCGLPVYFGYHEFHRNASDSDWTQARELSLSGDYEHAKIVYVKLLREQPQNFSAREDYADILLQTGDVKTAKKQYLILARLPFKRAQKIGNQGLRAISTNSNSR